MSPRTLRRLSNDDPTEEARDGSDWCARIHHVGRGHRQLHLFVYPIAVGTGPRLFPDGAPPRKLDLLACNSYDNGVVHLAHRPAPD